MPVSVPKITIDVDCYELPLKLEYSGPNPQNIYFEIKNLLKRVMKVEDKDIEEREVYWDRTTKGDKFKAFFVVNKKLDNYSHFHFEVSLEGHAKPSEVGKEGSVLITIDPVVRIEYPQETLFEKSIFAEIFRFFHQKFFYKEVREKYEEECRRLVELLKQEIKSFFNILAGV